MQATFVPSAVPERPRRVGALLGDALRRRGARRSVSVLTVALLLSGVAMFAYPLGTDLYARFRQDHLQSAFANPSVKQAYRDRTVAIGDGLTLLRIPKIGEKTLVVQGTTEAALRAGAGHYVETPLPGEAGNVAIAGHRTTYSRPFNRLDELRPGDVVTLETPFAVYTYTALPPFGGHANPWVVAPTDISVIRPLPGHLLTLTTCNPKGSAAQRLIMRFTLTATKLKG